MSIMRTTSAAPAGTVTPMLAGAPIAVVVGGGAAGRVESPPVAVFATGAGLLVGAGLLGGTLDGTGDGTGAGIAARPDE
ncbi:MAG: hypothetical protein EXQ56_13385 [Acidobacteria bacterium]|nr:hypothetical protein [Acidobacteriota bacterium]